MKLNKFQLNIVSAAFFILLGIGIWFAVPYCVTFSDLYSMGVPWLNSYFMPRAMAVLLIASSFANILLTLVQIYLYKRHNKEVPMPKKLVLTDEMRVLALAVIFLVYFLMLKFLPFIVASAIAVTAALLLMKEKKPLHYIISIVFVIVIFLVFKYVLYVKLP